MFAAIAGCEAEHGDDETGPARALIHLGDPLERITEREAGEQRHS